MAKRKKSKGFQPNAPTRGVWTIGMVLGLAGIIGHFTRIEFISENHFWLILGGFIFLAIGTTFKDL